MDENSNNVQQGQTSANNYSLEHSVNPIIEKYYQALLPAVHTLLTVFATLSLKNRTKPLSIIFEASSGLGKTAVLQMAFPRQTLVGKLIQTSKLHKYVYRSDKFTPKAFVSHAASVKKEKLKEVDLLPRLENKVLITKELAPIFRGRDQDIQENFSILISVLDGKGFTSDSGTMGQRGYEKSIVFNWIGATTPLPVKTHRIMSQLGTRLLFYEVESVEPTDEELFAYAERGNTGEAEVNCNIAVNDFLIRFFECHPVGSLDANSIVIPTEQLQQIVKWARFIVKGRAEIKYENTDAAGWVAVSAKKPEGAYKVIDYLKEIAIGHALIHDRMEVNASDLDLVGHIAISSIPIHFRPIIREARKTDYVDSNRCEKICDVSRPTARKYMEELSLLGLVDLTEGSSKTNEADKIKLSEEFLWLRIE